jgi:hypothetical protein
MPIIWTADELIEEATRRLADLNRKLAKLQRSRSRTSASVKPQMIHGKQSCCSENTREK